ncbi:unnamed protein product [Amoebophrya sp. A25]|nr:unnamed protein product [Amoebophrya sp. A25]|eukprot:GSA25T00026971001.1
MSRKISRLETLIARYIADDPEDVTPTDEESLPTKKSGGALNDTAHFECLRCCRVKPVSLIPDPTSPGYEAEVHASGTTGLVNGVSFDPREDETTRHESQQLRKRKAVDGDDEKNAGLDRRAKKVASQESQVDTETSRINAMRAKMDEILSIADENDPRNIFSARGVLKTLKLTGGRRRVFWCNHGFLTDNMFFGRAAVESSRGSSSSHEREEQLQSHVDSFDNSRTLYNNPSLASSTSISPPRGTTIADHSLSSKNTPSSSSSSPLYLGRSHPPDYASAASRPFQNAVESIDGLQHLGNGCLHGPVCGSCAAYLQLQTLPTCPGCSELLDTERSFGWDLPVPRVIAEKWRRRAEILKNRRRSPASSRFKLEQSLHSEVMGAKVVHSVSWLVRETRGLVLKGLRAGAVSIMHLDDFTPHVTALLRHSRARIRGGQVVEDEGVASYRRVLDELTRAARVNRPSLLSTSSSSSSEARDPNERILGAAMAGDVAFSDSNASARNRVGDEFGEVTAPTARQTSCLQNKYAFQCESRTVSVALAVVLFFVQAVVALSALLAINACFFGPLEPGDPLRQDFASFLVEQSGFSPSKKQKIPSGNKQSAGARHLHHRRQPLRLTEIIAILLGPHWAYFFAWYVAWIAVGAPISRYLVHGVYQEVVTGWLLI